MSHSQTSEIFEHLFVLELANNHQGRLQRGLRIVRDFSRIVRFNNVKAAIKLQLRDVDAFIHRDFRERSDIRYIIELIKIASSDINDWILIEKIATTKKPVIVSTGGSSLKDIDDLVKFFHRRSIPLAINHCVSLYPSEDHELELNQIDFLRRRYPHNVIGFSTHEHLDWQTSITIAYAKGARTFERHIDIAADGMLPAAYCSLPHQIDEWFKAHRKAAEMCGAPGTQKRIPPNRESRYLDALVRGVYARRDLKQGHALCDDDIYLAIPLQKGQISCRELMRGEVLLSDVAANGPLMIDMIDSPYAESEQLKALIYQRGL